MARISSIILGQRSAIGPAGRSASVAFDSSDRAFRSSFLAVCVASSAWILAYILYRVVQPYPLDAFEEYQLAKAIRWTEGVPLYGPPETEVFPEAYPPLYFWSLGLWVKCFGASFVAQRALSLVALVGIVACGWWGLREGGQRAVSWPAFLTLFLACHGLTAKFFEVGKPDTLLALWLALAIVTGEHRSWREAIVSSAALWLASLTKQNAPLFLVPLCIAHLLAGRWRWAAGWGCVMSAAIAGSYAVLDWLSNGNLFQWVFRWTAGHGIDLWAGLAATGRVVATRAPWLLVVLLAAVVLRPRCRWTWCLLVALAVAAMGMSKAGGRENHLLASAFLATGIVADWFGLARSNSPTDRQKRLWQWSAMGLIVLAVWPSVPSRADFRWVGKRRQEIRAWTDAVRQLDGSVAVSHHFLLAREAQAESFFSDLILEFPGLTVPSSVDERIGRQEFDYLLLEAEPEKSTTARWRELIADHYTSAGDLKFRNRSDVLPKRLYRARRLASYNEP